MVEEGIDIAWTFILEVEVIGVLPYIHGEQRRDARFGERGFGVRRLAHFELAIFGHQPCPARPKLGFASGRERLAEAIIAAKAVIDWAFEYYSLNRIQAHFMSTNIGSGKVMEKLGMKREGLFRDMIFHRGFYRDAVFYSILRPEWELQQ